MEIEKEKVKKVSKTILTILKVVKILTIIGIVCCSIGMICSFVSIAFLDEMKEWIVLNQDAAQKIQITINSGSNIVQIKENISLYDAYTKGYVSAKTFLFFAGECFGGLVSTSITLVLSIFISKIFKGIMEKESPFDASLEKDLKVSFIAITILVLFNSDFLIAVIVGLSLLCFYYLYKYGVSLQKESDETL